MIAAATQGINSGRLLFNWFDVAIILVLALGFWRGRKNGMSKEFLPCSLWVAIVFAAGLGYELVGDQFVKWGAIRSIFGTAVNQRTAADLSGYLLITLAVWLVYVPLKRRLKPKLEGSNAFGAGEYYLGIAAGMIRFACMVVFALSLLHAPFYTPEQIAAKQAYNNRVYGGGMAGFSGDFIPTLDEVQADVFTHSLFGPSINKWFTGLLIQSVPPGGPAKPAVISIGS